MNSIAYRLEVPPGTGIETAFVMAINRWNDIRICFPHWPIQIKVVFRLDGIWCRVKDPCMDIGLAATNHRAKREKREAENPSVGG